MERGERRRIARGKAVAGRVVHRPGGVLGGFQLRIRDEEPQIGQELDCSRAVLPCDAETAFGGRGRGKPVEGAHVGDPQPDVWAP